MNYYDRKEISCSDIKLMSNHILDYVYNVKKESRALEFGTITHEFILEDKHNYVKLPDELIGMSKLKKEYKNWKKSLPNDAIIVDDKDLTMLNEMKESCFTHKDFSDLMSHPSTVCEEEFFENYKGIECRSKMDVVNVDLGEIWDLKTIEKITTDSIMKSIVNYKYYFQSYFYKEMAKRKYQGVDNWRFKFIFVEKQYPHRRLVVELDDSWDDIARNKIDEALNNWLMYQTGSPDVQLDDLILEKPKWLQ